MWPYVCLKKINSISWSPCYFTTFTLTSHQGFNLAMFYWLKLSRRHVLGAVVGWWRLLHKTKLALLTKQNIGLRASCTCKVYNCIRFYVVVCFCSSLWSLFLSSVAFLRLTTKFNFSNVSRCPHLWTNIQWTSSQKRKPYKAQPLTIPQKKLVELWAW